MHLIILVIKKTIILFVNSSIQKKPGREYIIPVSNAEASLALIIVTDSLTR